MTFDRMPFRPRAVIQPSPPRKPGADRAGRVRPYYRHQVQPSSHQTHLTWPAGQAAPMRDRAVLERVLVGLRALGPRPAVPQPVSPLVGNGAATATGAPPALVAVPSGDMPPAPPAREATVRSLLGRELMPLVRAVLARRPEAALPAERVEPSPDVVRTQPLGVVGVAS